MTKVISKQKIETLRGKLFIKECFIGSIVRHHKCLTKAQSADRSVDLGKATSFKLENQEGTKEGTLQKSSIKDAGRMPWHFGPTKDVISCEKPRGGAHIHRSADI